MSFCSVMFMVIYNLLSSTFWLIDFPGGGSRSGTVGGRPQMLLLHLT